MQGKHSDWQARVDIIALVAIVAAILALFAAIVDRGFSQPAAVATGPLATVTPQPTPTGGWWDQVRLTPAPLPGLPALPTVSLGGAGATAGAAVPFAVVSCPQPTVKITQIVTAKSPWWNVYGAATIPNLEYWKAELSADGQHWTLLYRAAAAVVDGLLIEFNTRTVPAGGYQLRLLAVDKTGNYGEPCTVQITTP